IVYAVRQKDADDDGQLVEADHEAARSCGGNLGDIKRREGGSDSDGQSTEQASDHELGEITRQGGSQRGNREQRRRSKEHSLPSKTVAGEGSQAGPNHASQEQAAGGDFG